MKCNYWWTLLPLLAVLMPTAVANAVTVASVSFQQDVDGYTGTFDHRISSDRIDNPATTREVDGSTVTNYIVDGYAAPSDTSSGSLDEQGLLRFDNLFGAGPGQVPVGAFILEADLQISTHTGSNSDSPGPFGVARLLQPFSSTTSYTDFPRTGGGTGPASHRGAWYQDGFASRAAGGYASQPIGSVGNADIAPIVQAWSNGAPNDGVVIQSGFSGQTNGWIIQTTGNGDTARRPKLSVSYTTDPIRVTTFQRGAAGYDGDTMAWVRGGSVEAPDVATFDGYSGAGTNGTSLVTDPPADANFQQFLDGPNATDSPNDLALIKFDDVFGTGAGQASPTVPVAKAWLVLTTGDASGNARSGGTYVAHPMLRDWDTTSLYSSFGAEAGLTEADGDIGPQVDAKFGMITGSEVWFDVTSYLEEVRNGATDYGLAIMSGGTTDGWQIHFNGSAVASARPRLVVASAVPEPASIVLCALGFALAVWGGINRRQR